MCVCVCVCVCACACARARVCVCVCVCVLLFCKYNRNQQTKYLIVLNLEYSFKTTVAQINWAIWMSMKHLLWGNCFLCQNPVLPAWKPILFEQLKCLRQRVGGKWEIHCFVCESLFLLNTLYWYQLLVCFILTLIFYIYSYGSFITLWWWPNTWSSHNELTNIHFGPTCRSKPIRPLFIFRTQMKIFLMKSESFLTVYRQQRNWNVQSPERK